MSGTRFQSRLTQYCDDNGDPLPAGKLLFTISETTTLQETYADDDLMTENANPVVLDADGRQSTDIFLDPALSYRVRLYSSTDVLIADDDPIGGNDVSVAVEAHNDDPAAHYAASESQRGFVELASQSEVNTGTDTARAVTPAGLANRTATETRAGVVELATSAEVVAGVDTNRAVTPAGFAAALAGGTLYASIAETFAGSSTAKAITPAGFAGNITKAATGNVKLPGGLELKWGPGASTVDAPETFTFAAPFASACYVVFITRRTDNVTGGLFVSNNTPPTTTGFTIDRDSSFAGTTNFYYLAIGS